MSDNPRREAREVPPDEDSPMPAWWHEMEQEGGLTPQDIRRLRDMLRRPVMHDAARFEALDAEPEEEWLVAPSHEIQPEERLQRDEMRLLGDVLRQRAPNLLPQLEWLGVRVQRPSEREQVREVLLRELADSGVEKGGLNSYGLQIDNLICRLGRI